MESYTSQGSCGSYAWCESYGWCVSYEEESACAGIGAVACAVDGPATGTVTRVAGAVLIANANSAGTDEVEGAGDAEEEGYANGPGAAEEAEGADKPAEAEDS